VNVSTPPVAERPPSQKHVREYETIYILRFDVDADAAERVQARVADAVEREHGKLVKVETWGRRRLAYPIRKHRRGVYVYLKYVGAGGMVAEIERNLKLQDAVVKYMTVQTADHVDLASLQIDPEETKLAKLEPPPEDEKEESREKQLGLVDLGPDAPRAPRPPEDVEDFEAPPAEEPEEGAAAKATPGEEET
jgi:small subunit ribosomal protein S6